MHLRMIASRVSAPSCRGFWTATLFLLVNQIASGIASYSPEQIHVAYANGEDEVLVVWASPVKYSLGASVPQYVQYGKTENMLSSTVNATSYSYSAGNFSNTLLKATLQGLQYDGSYFYRVGGPTFGWSSVIPYRHKPKPGTTDTVKFLSYGDAGIAWSDGTNDYVSKDAATGEYSLLVNVGDISYANDYGATNNSWVNDEFFRRAQPYASRVPYMTAPGNHDSQFDFAAYLNRSIMPQQGSGPLSRFYYSFDWGPVHFLSFSTEHTFETGGEQWQFIKDDLERTASRRHITPWVVVWGHRPLYCTDLITWKSRCVQEATQYREWLEGLFHQYHVDAYLCGHNHQLEYTKPVFNETQVDSSYHNARGTVYIVNGAAGDKEGIDPTFMPGDIPWRQWTSSLSLHTAYTRVTANQTALSWEFVDSDTGKIANSFTMSKDEEPVL